MRANFILKYLSIFSVTCILIFIPFKKSFGEENVFTINNVKVKGAIDTNFSREKFLNKAFLNSFEILMNKILLTRDLKKINNINLNQIKRLIKGFQVLEESYRENIYRANIKIYYNEDKIKKFLSKKNISFSLSENISAVFFPVLIVKDEIQNYDENFFYLNWLKMKIDNEIINFILPLEDLEDISLINEMPKAKIAGAIINSTELVIAISMKIKTKAK